MNIQQGDIFRVGPDAPVGMQPAGRHLYVVVQNDVFNQSRIRTVVLCALTANLKRSTAPGNILLEKGEAQLAEPCVVNVAQMVTVDKSRLTERVGRLPARRVRQILDGINFVLAPHDAG